MKLSSLETALSTEIRSATPYALAGSVFIQKDQPDADSVGLDHVFWLWHETDLNEGAGLGSDRVAHVYQGRVLSHDDANPLQVREISADLRAAFHHNRPFSPDGLLWVEYVLDAIDVHEDEDPDADVMAFRLIFHATAEPA